MKTGNVKILVAAAASVLVLGAAVAEAGDVAGQKRTMPLVQTASQDSIATEPTAAGEVKAEIGQATAEKIVAAAPCARKVKVIYSGYGEADRAGCPTGRN